MKKIFFKTKDGSPSILIEELDESYHSRHGAITESNYIYIKKGLNSWIDKYKKKKVKIFEMGMGTGLNAYLAFCFVRKKNKTQLLHSRKISTIYSGNRKIIYGKIFAIFRIPSTL